MSNYEIIEKTEESFFGYSGWYGAITEGSVALGSMQNGKFVERKFKTFEVWYSRYDEQEGWLECVLTIMYES